jgi:ATP-dependent exoDNAse (exonuclease V) beta subunit
MLPVRYSSALKHSVFRNYYYLEKRNMYVDALNILYVAFTRAVDELYVYSPKPSGDKIKNVGDLLYFCINQSIASDEGKIIGLSSYFNEDTLQLTLNTDHQVLTPGFKENAKKFEIRQFKNLDWNQKLSIKYNADDFFAKSNPFIQERINYGSFMHDVMSRITYAEDAPQVLQEMKFQGRITETQKSELQQLLNEAFQIPQVKEWFSHDWKQIITERALLTTEGHIRIPDRVLVSDKKTVVIDFKFGKERDEYRDQITEYAQLLSKMKTPKYPPVEAYLYYVESGKTVKIL